MRKLWLILCSVCLLSCGALAQVKMDNQWKCGKATIQHSIDVGDKPGHAYAVDQINCTAPKGEIDGVKRKSGMGTEFIEVTGDKFTGHGEFVETMANGDKNFYTYQMMGTMKNGVLQAGSDKWTLREGGGKLKGAKASGTCKGAGNADQSATWDCTGEYTMAKK
ncbi:MAG: hypothetical protein LAN70_05410 [Acidobacteriia bacterium]|nr:hypothetical protein [Terriglobia bacterium]